MSEINYGELYGVGENEAAPAEQPAAETESVSEPVAETHAEDAGAKETEPAAQSAEENSKYAAARRKAEADAKRQVDEAIASLGLTDTYTGKAITTKAEYDAFRAKEANAKKSEIADAAGMTSEAFDGFINNLPQVQEYKQAAEAARQQQQKMVLDEQIKQISALDPAIKSVQDLLGLPEYGKIYEQVKRGNSIVDAYKLVNFDKLTAAAAAREKQATLNAANSKDHMAPTSSRGTGSLTVPADVKAMYRLYNPDATDAEIHAHYNKYHNK